MVTGRMHLVRSRHTPARHLAATPVSHEAARAGLLSLSAKPMNLSKGADAISPCWCAPPSAAASHASSICVLLSRMIAMVVLRPQV